jgi:predicted RNase H-like nuclease (RuvC/YqgF family)
VLAGLAGLLAGCSFVPKSRLEDSRLRVQALQAENARLKDQALALRNQNRDLTQRALDDAHRQRALEEANARLEHNLAVYQDEREQMIAAFESLRQEIQAAAETEATASRRPRSIDRSGTAQQ